MEQGTKCDHALRTSIHKCTTTDMSYNDYSQFLYKQIRLSVGFYLPALGDWIGLFLVIQVYTNRQNIFKQYGIVLLSFSWNHVNSPSQPKVTLHVEEYVSNESVSLHSWLSLCDKLGRETKIASISDRLLTLSKHLS